MSSSVTALFSRARPTFFKCDADDEVGDEDYDDKDDVLQGPRPPSRRDTVEASGLPSCGDGFACGVNFACGVGIENAGVRLSAAASARKVDSTAALSCALASILATAGSASPLANAGNPDAERPRADGPFCGALGVKAARDGRAASAEPFAPATDLTELAWRRVGAPALINAASLLACSTVAKSTHLNVVVPDCGAGVSNGAPSPPV